MAIKPKNPIDPTKRSHRGCANKIRAIKSKFPELPNAAIAQRVGCTTDNVADVLRRFLGPHSVEDMRSFQQNKADVYDSVQHRLLLSVTQDKIDKSPLMSTITAVAILEDKARLVRGQATGILEHVTVLLDVVEAIKMQDQAAQVAAQQRLRASQTIDAQGQKQGS